MYFIDTHSHLYLPDFKNDIFDVVQRAISADLKKIILPNIDSSTLTDLLKLKNDFPNLFVPLIGLHPTHVKENYLDELEFVSQQLKRNEYRGIGEIGIDLYWDKTRLKEQITAFEYQLKLAILHNLPVVIHARESFDEIFNSLRSPEFKNVKGIFHAFTGNLEQAEFIINLGLKIGIGGIVTYKNSALAEVVEAIDIEHIVLETDSPYLPPVPYRGKRNESSFIVKTAEKIAEVKALPIEEVAMKTSRNAELIFGL